MKKKQQIKLSANQEKRRRELLKKQIQHGEEMDKCKEKIAQIDEAIELAKRKWMVGKCFAMKSEHSSRAGDAGYCRVDEFNKNGKRPCGVKIHLHKRKVASIEFNSNSLWEDDILRGKKISRAQFNKYLEQARILTHTPEKDTIREKIKLIKPAYTNFADKMKKIMPTVAYILKRDADARDDDNLMCVLLWALQGARDNIKFSTFKKKLIMGELATPESITRNRRRLQEKYPDLRGKFYDERHNQEELLRAQLRIDFDL